MDEQLEPSRESEPREATEGGLPLVVELIPGGASDGLCTDIEGDRDTLTFGQVVDDALAKDYIEEDDISLRNRLGKERGGDIVAGANRKVSYEDKIASFLTDESEDGREYKFLRARLIRHQEGGSYGGTSR